ncbi:polysaccharide deacetylase family protein [Acidaminobacterium chupaoyuni]
MKFFTKKTIALLCLFLTILLILLLRLLHPLSVPAMAEGQGTPLPVVMYHHVLSDGSRLLGAYVVSVSELESDLCWLKAAGYTPILPSALTAYVESGAPLPPKPILLSFDDGYESFYANALPLLQKYQSPAVVSVIGRYTDLYSQPGESGHLNYSHITWDQLKSLENEPLVEVGSHSYDRHDATGKHSPRGAKQERGQTDEAYLAALRSDTQKLQDAIAAHGLKLPTLYAYPFGYYTDQSEAMLGEMGFRITLSCEEGCSVITRDPASLRLLKRYNRAHGRSSADFFAKMGLAA